MTKVVTPDSSSYGPPRPAILPFPGPSFCSEEREFLLAGVIKESRRPRPVHVIFQGESGDVAYQVDIHVGSKPGTMERWSRHKGTKSSTMVDETDIEPGRLFELR